MAAPLGSIVRRAVRVGAGALRDRIAARPAVHKNDVPASVEQVTPEWLTAVLCEGIDGARVIDFSLTGGDSGSSTRRGLALSLNPVAQAAGVPDSLFTKSAPGFVQRMFLGLSEAARGEALFYSLIRPQVELEAPKAYHACIDSRSWRTITLMEDLRATRSARFISTETYIDQEMMADLLGNLARLHARFWNSPQLQDELSGVRTTACFLSDMSQFISFKDRAFLAMKQYPQLLPEGLYGARESLWDSTVATYANDLSGPQTLLHGDAHIGQAYITGDGRMGYCDWQLVQQGSWAADFAYALTSALTIADRRNWEKALLLQYIDDLHGAGGPRLDFETAWLGYCQHTLYPFFAWAFTRAGAGSMLPDMQPGHVCDEIMKRTAQAVADSRPYIVQP